MEVAEDHLRNMRSEKRRKLEEEVANKSRRSKLAESAEPRKDDRNFLYT